MKPGGGDRHVKTDGSVLREGWRTILQDRKLASVHAAANVWQVEDQATSKRHNVPLSWVPTIRSGILPVGKQVRTPV